MPGFVFLEALRPDVQQKTDALQCSSNKVPDMISFSVVMSTTSSTRDPYLVKSLVHASQVLGVFQFSGETLRLRDIAARSGLNKGMVFRLLYTLQRCGMVEKTGDNQYQSCIRVKSDESFLGCRGSNSAARSDARADNSSGMTSQPGPAAASRFSQAPGAY
jgi:hypothetical protein